MIHDWWRIWWREKIFSLPGEAPPRFVVARPWWRRVKEALEKYGRRMTTGFVWIVIGVTRGQRLTR
jgi:hypothetical protein